MPSGPADRVTLGQVIAAAIKAGWELVTMKPVTGPRGLVSFRYLRRRFEDGRIVVVDLPNLSNDAPLTGPLLGRLGDLLEIPKSFFGLGPE